MCTVPSVVSAVQVRSAAVEVQSSVQHSSTSLCSSVWLRPLPPQSRLDIPLRYSQVPVSTSAIAVLPSHQILRYLSSTQVLRSFQALRSCGTTQAPGPVVLLKPPASAVLPNPPASVVLIKPSVSVVPSKTPASIVLISTSGPVSPSTCAGLEWVKALLVSELVCAASQPH